MFYFFCQNFEDISIGKLLNSYTVYILFNLLMCNSITMYNVHICVSTCLPYNCYFFFLHNLDVNLFAFCTYHQIHKAQASSTIQSNVKKTLQASLFLPVLFQLNRDLVEYLYFANEDSTFSRNVKKGIVALFQVQENEGHRREVCIWLLQYKDYLQDYSCLFFLIKKIPRVLLDYNVYTLQV